MATLPGTLKPVVGFNKNYKKSYIENDFGDGYKQIIHDGINPVARILNVTLIGKESQIDVYNDFLNDNVYFDWQPPKESSSSKWICREWSVTFKEDIGECELTAVFERIIYY